MIGNTFLKKIWWSIWLKRIWVVWGAEGDEKHPNSARLTSPPSSPPASLLDFWNSNSTLGFCLKFGYIGQFVFFRLPSCTSAFCRKSALHQFDVDVPLFRYVAELPLEYDGRWSHFPQDSFQTVSYVLLFLPAMHLSTRFRCQFVFLGSKNGCTHLLLCIGSIFDRWKHSRTAHI